MPTILVVDDSATDRLLAGGLLTENGDFDVEYAVDGSDAIIKIELHVPDLIVTDMDMPELNGMELVAVIRRAYPLVPVVLMTARGSEELALQALRAGAASYVPKRQLHTELLETVLQVYSAAREDRGRIRLMRRMTEQQVQFTIENDHELIASLVQYLKDGAAGMGVCDEGERVRTGVALQEALTNACLHGNLEVNSALREVDHKEYYDLARERMSLPPYSQRRIHVTARYSLDSAEFCIRDEGPGFNRSELPDPTDPTNIERPCGRGLLLMQTFMDEIKYNATGNEVTMIKRRKTSTVRS
ncbi:MAG: ATP-binding protein [Planctomycetes bacterium]|nr:ATP-binding protein [Planctomycetota bacterium]